MLAAYNGLLKCTKDQVIKHYHKRKTVRSLSHVTDSLYLVGFYRHGLILWNEQTDQQLSRIFDDPVLSIRRVLTTNNYIIKTPSEVKVVSINESSQFSVQQLLNARESWNLPDSLQLQITHSHIMIVTIYSENKIKLMRVPIAEI